MCQAAHYKDVKRQKMKSHHYLAIIIRLFSIVLLAYSLRQWVFAIEILINGEASGIRFPAMFAVATALIPMLFAILLWKFPLTISKTIVSDEYNQEIKPLNAQSFLAVLIISLGVYFLFYAVIDSIYWLTIYKATQVGTSSGASIGLSEDNTANMVATAVELILAFVLIAKAKTISFHLVRFSQ